MALSTVAARRCRNLSRVLLGTILMALHLRPSASFLRHQGSIRPRGNTYNTQQANSPSSLNSLVLPQHGHSIESIAAPMVAASDYAFRSLCRRYGVDLTYTQMLHTENLLNQEAFRKNHLDLWEYTSLPASWCREQQEFLDGGSCFQKQTREGRMGDGVAHGPVIVQLAGYSPSRVVEAARLILDHTAEKVHGFDLNLGCPQAIARKGRYGAFLMEHDPTLACAILSALRQALPDSVSVSAKIRLPLDSRALPERITRLLDTGIDFLTVHGRTLRENKVAVGACHFEQIALAVDLADRHTTNFPVVANGGVEQFTDVEAVRKATGAAAIMSSEALLENPGLFSVNSSSWNARQKFEQQFQYAFEYLNLCQAFPPLPGVLGQSCNIVRSHLFKFLFRYLSEQPDLRDKMASHRIRHLVDFEQVCLELYKRYDDMSDDELDGCRSTKASASWYRRHRLSTEASSALSSGMSVEQRKEATQLRIAELRKQREEKVFIVR